MDRQRALAAARAEARHLRAQQLSEVTPSRRDFAQYVATQKRELAVIARVGATHAPDGQPWSAAQLVAYARQCDDADVAALAVMTGAEGVSIVELAAVADGTTAPILRDDLILDPNQLYHSRLHGADAAVFPAADLDESALHELVVVASSLHMASVVEVLSAAEIEAALRSPHTLIGLRCAGTDGRLDVERTRQLARQLPSQRTVICLPEVQSAADCAALREICDAVVAGDVLVAAVDIAVVLQELIAG